ncbi:hypothetical protein [Candidatus Poriferisodalis sp.]|uniref:hypothetical protein n=1 Tax=Candidatus Poriferisodalis sp. TaxID=3101277 RepID=UPI003C7044FA
MTSTDPILTNTDPNAEPLPVPEDMWQGADDVGLDADCSPTKVCRNARDFTFDGIAEDDEDLATSWRKLLEREGKSSPDGTTVRDLVLGPKSGD